MKVHSHIRGTLSLLLGACIMADAGSDIIGDVRGIDGRPLTGVSVHLVAPAGGGTERYFTADSTISDSAGCVRLFHLHAPGSVKVVYSKDGYQSLSLTAPYGSLLARAILTPAGSSDSSRGQLQRRALNDSSTVC